jgi:diaminopimelate epimerase
MIDNRSGKFPVENTQLIKDLCSRRFGIGADGCILLHNHPNVDFKMVYFNADGNESTMCGNGGRCLVSFAKYLGVIEKTCEFEAIDGIHQGVVSSENWISLKMTEVEAVETYDSGFFLDTGSPHIVMPVSSIDSYDVFNIGRGLRNAYSTAGSNVNFIEWKQDILKVRTYERGVEDETFSCGTGVTAAAIATAQKEIGKTYTIPISTLGGRLTVKFSWTGTGATDIWLNGPAVQVFKGEWV